MRWSMTGELDRGKLVLAAMVLGPFVAFLVYLGIGSGAPPRGLPPAYPGHLWVAFVLGTATGGGDRKLHSGDVIEPGELVRSGEHSELILLTPPGDRVVLRAQSKVLRSVGVMTRRPQPSI